MGEGIVRRDPHRFAVGGKPPGKREERVGDFLVGRFSG
jgi:hypothetical protein